MRAAFPQKAALMNFDVSADGRLLKIVIEGTLTKAGILDLWDAIEANPGYANATAGLVLYGYGVKWEVSGAEIASLAREVGRLRTLRWAIVTPDPLSYGMNRMFAAQAETEDMFGVFSDGDSAREWLSRFL